MFTEIDHIAIAVKDLDAAIAFYRNAFDVQVEHDETIVSDGVREVLIKVAQSYIQLLTPINDNSPVAKFLANRGEGLHHVGYRVESCETALNAVMGLGYQVIDTIPRPGSRGTTIAFIHPKGAFGTLIELVEIPV